MSGSPIRFNKSLQYDLKTPVNYIREKPPELTNLHESPKSTNSDEPLKLIDLDKPPKSTNSNEPPKSTNSDESPKSINSDESPKSTNSDKPPKSTNSDKPSKSINSDEPPKSTNSDEQYELPETDIYIQYLPNRIKELEVVVEIKSIKSSKAILDYELCQKWDIPILTEDPPRSLILNICGDMIYWTCARETNKRETLYCSYGKDNDSNPLLPSENLEFNDDLFEKAYDKCSEIISKVPLLRLNASVSKPVVLLSCRHKTILDVLVIRKRKKKDDSCKFTSDTKDQTIIHELSICPASEVSIDIPPEDSNMRKVLNQFHKLYYEIDNAEKNGN
ncbi:3267_t:CDS:2 [Funneliformis geosporum]|nr:3267_t:CDS:2 [Funneliformis geosporum]